MVKLALPEFLLMESVDIVYNPIVRSGERNDIGEPLIEDPDGDEIEFKGVIEAINNIGDPGRIQVDDVGQFVYGGYKMIYPVGISLVTGHFVDALSGRYQIGRIISYVSHNEAILTKV